jgi:hypothetical protein
LISNQKALGLRPAGLFTFLSAASKLGLRNEKALTLTIEGF